MHVQPPAQNTFMAMASWDGREADLGRVGKSRRLRELNPLVYMTFERQTFIYNFPFFFTLYKKNFSTGPHWLTYTRLKIA